VYYVDHFGLTLKQAGLAAGSFGLLALFARALGGFLSDKMAVRGSLNSRVTVLFVMMIGEGLGLLWFANADGVVYAVIAMLVFGLFTHMACGATYALVPFIDSKALGGVAGIIGAGGNGAIAASILGAVAGGMAGKSIEANASNKPGLEITVRLDNGDMRAIVQDADELFRPGERVRLLSDGRPTRVTH